MKTVRLATQVADFVSKLAPVPKRRVRAAFRALAHERGDIKPLAPPLDGYCRLRIGGYRVVFAYADRNTIESIFIEQRSVVYDLLVSAIEDALITRER